MRMQLFPFQEDALDELNKKINKAQQCILDLCRSNNVIMLYTESL